MGGNMANDKLGLFGDTLKIIAKADYPLTLSTIIVYSIFIYAVLLGVVICFSYILGKTQLITRHHFIIAIYQMLALVLTLGIRLDIYSYNSLANMKYEQIILLVIIPSIGYILLTEYKNNKIIDIGVLAIGQAISIIMALVVTRTITYKIWCSTWLSGSKLPVLVIFTLVISFITLNIKNNLSYYKNSYLMSFNIAISIISMVLIILWQTCIISLKLDINNILSLLILSLILLICYYYTYSEYKLILNKAQILSVLILFIPHVVYSAMLVFSATGGL